VGEEDVCMAKTAPESEGGYLRGSDDNDRDGISLDWQQQDGFEDDKIYLPVHQAFCLRERFERVFDSVVRKEAVGTVLRLS
jgi:hypothetical protein